MGYIETQRIILRSFDEKDIPSLYLLLKDENVNTFLPWFPVKSMEEAEKFYERRFSPLKEENMYYYAICLKEDNIPVGYVKAETDESHDFGYALCSRLWHRGIVTEAAGALAEKLKQDGIPYITATHDRNNPRSGGVMRQIGMKYCYSYREQWQPKNLSVVFRLYMLNLDGNNSREYNKYRIMYENHFVEKGL